MAGQQYPFGTRVTKQTATADRLATPDASDCPFWYWHNEHEKPRRMKCGEYRTRLCSWCEVKR